MERIKYILLFLLIPSVCFGAINEKYSYKDFSGQSFKDVPVEEFNNSTIASSVFYQENEPDKDIFPDGLVNVEFKRCNLSNVLVKTGMVVDYTNVVQKIKVQNDLEDWIVVKNGEEWNPVEPTSKEQFIELNISIDPKDIPATKKEASITEEKADEKAVLDAN